jgi:glycosyltransferase involved in cell wall biosynthesis
MDSSVSISVIIPAYNAQDTIISSLESILSQTFKANYEIIVINDGSIDSTEEVIHNFKKKYQLDNLILISQNNLGPSKARNVGIEASSGDWIAFLDSDDSWLFDKIMMQQRALNEMKNCVLIGTKRFGSKVNHSTTIISFSNLVFRNRFITSSVLVKRNILTKYLFDEKKKYAEDYKLWLQIAYSNQVCLCNDGLVKYNDSLNSNTKLKSLSSNFLEMEKGELDNYKYLLENNMISRSTYCSAVLFSILRYIRRLLKYVFK